MTEAAPILLHAERLGKVWADGDRSIDIAIESLSLCAGDFVAITGPSGCGKSTALDLMSLVLRPEPGGSLHLTDGRALRDISGLLYAQSEGALARLRAQTFGYVVQTSELIPFLTIRENCALQQDISGRGTAADITETATALDVTKLFSAYPAELSVGQRQRVAIVRALCSLPLIVLADEPTASQDPQLKDTIMDVFRDATRRGTAVVMVTHDLELVDRHGLDRVGIDGVSRGNDWQCRFVDRRAAA